MGVRRLISSGIKHAAGPAIKRALHTEAGKAILKVAPTPAEVTAAADKAVDKIRESNPQAMAKVGQATDKVVSVVAEYFPDTVARAKDLVSEARGIENAHAGEWGPRASADR